MIAVQNIDEVIAIIKASKTAEEARNTLAARFGLTDMQTQAIVDMRLRALTGLAIEELQRDLDAIHARIDELLLILNDPNVLRALIESELREISNKYGDARRTAIDYTAGTFNAEDFYADDDMIITISHLGYIKRTPLGEFRAQNRGGVGAKGTDTRDGAVLHRPRPRIQNACVRTARGKQKQQGTRSSEPAQYRAGRQRECVHSLPPA